MIQLASNNVETWYFCGFHKGTDKIFIFHRQLDQLGREAGKGVFCPPLPLIDQADTISELRYKSVSKIDIVIVT